MEGVVTGGLECGQGSGEAQGHDQVFESSVAGAEGCSPCFSFLAVEGVVGTTNIELGGNAGPLDRLEGLVDER